MKNGDVELQQVATGKGTHHRLEHDTTNCGKTYVTPSTNGNFCFSVALIAAAFSLVVGNVILIPAIEFAVGALYLRDCPFSTYVPISLMFIGVARLLYYAVSTYVSHKRTGVAEADDKCCTGPNVLLGFLYLIYLAAVISGAVSTFSLITTIRNANTTKNSNVLGDPSDVYYCNKMAYSCAAAFIGIELILLTLGWVIYICRRCFIHCSQSN